MRCSIPLDRSALDELEVTLGPRANAETMKAVELILEKYAPLATLTRSYIPIR